MTTKKLPKKLKFKQRKYKNTLGIVECMIDIGKEMQEIKATINEIIDYIEVPKVKKSVDVDFSFKHQLELLKKFNVGEQLKVKGYSKIFWLQVIDCDMEKEEIVLIIARHPYDMRYFADMKRKINVGCSHTVRLAGIPHFFSLEKV